MPGDFFNDLASGVLDSGAFNEVEDRPQLAEHAEDDDYSDAFKAFALRIWTFEGGRDAGKTAEIVGKRSGREVDAVTVKAWMTRYEWGEGSDRLHQSFVHHATSAVEAQLVLASVKAASTILEILDDKTADAQTRLRAATLALSLNGYSPHVAGSSLSLQVNVNRTDMLQQASDSELASLASGWDADNASIDPILDTTWQEVATSGQSNWHNANKRQPITVPRQ